MYLSHAKEKSKLTDFNLIFLGGAPTSTCHWFCLSVCPSVRLSVQPSVRLSIHPSVHLSIHLSVHLSVCPSIHPSIRLSIQPSIHPTVCPFIRLSVHPTVRPSVQPSVRLSVCPSNRPFVRCTPYLRNHTSSGHNFWYKYIKWWYLQAFFSFFLILIFWAVRGVKGQKIAQNEKYQLHLSCAISQEQ